MEIKAKLGAKALDDFEQAARQGMESTKDLLAKMSRASRLIERIIGHQDSGATSCYYILRSLSSTIARSFILDHSCQTAKVQRIFRL